MGDLRQRKVAPNKHGRRGWSLRVCSRNVPAVMQCQPEGREHGLSFPTDPHASQPDARIPGPPGHMAVSLVMTETQEEA